MRLTRTLGFAGALVLSALIGGTLIGSALATDKVDGTAAAGSAGEYCDTFMDSLASELGTDRDGLLAAGRAAALATIDSAVANGDLSDERAEDARERVEAVDGDGCGWLGRGMAFGRGLARGFLGGDVFEAAADALGIESSELIGRLRDAGSLEALASELGASYDDVQASVLTAVQADLDAAVAEGLDQERADAALERISAWLEEGGELGDMRPGRGPGGWGDRGGFGPWGPIGPGDEVEQDEGA